MRFLLITFLLGLSAWATVVVPPPKVPSVAVPAPVVKPSVPMPVPTPLAPPTPASPPSDPTKISCTVNRIDVCSGAHFYLPPVRKDDFDKSFEDRQEKFIQWLKPMAFFVQSTTGLPSAILIGQAGIASDWGASMAFTKHNNIFKMSCWHPKAVLSGEVQVGQKKYSYKGQCSSDKAAGKLGKIMSFPTREDSLYAYLGMILNSKSRLYRPLQEHLKHSLTTRPPRPPSFRSVSAMMAPFGADPNYVGALNRAIALYKMSENEPAACWTCLRGPMEVAP